MPMNDPSESNKANPALKESEERSQKIFTYSNDAILVIDPAQDSQSIAEGPPGPACAR